MRFIQVDNSPSDFIYHFLCKKLQADTNFSVPAFSFYLNIYCAVSISDSTVLIALFAFLFSLGLRSTAFLPAMPTAKPAASPIAAPFTTFIIGFELKKHTSVNFYKI